jgi:hypothetical protein
MDEVRLALAEDAFHRLLSEAIETNFRQDPATYIKCPGSDCTSYFTATESGTHMCPSRFTISCRECKVEYHFDESRAQYQERMAGSDEKFRKWVEDQCAKHCPRCNGVVQKDSGCNHITCGWCDQHFCFACLKMFDKEDDVYQHMAREHGRFYANEQEEREANERAIRLAQVNEGRLDLLGFADFAPQIGQPVRLARPNLLPAGLGQAHPRPPADLARPPPAPRTQEEIDAQLARQEAFAGLFDDEDAWMPVAEAWERDAGVGFGGMW